MRALLIVSLLLAATAVSVAQQPRAAQAPRTGEMTDSITLTPEMWFYKQEMSRHDNPKEYVRRKAQFRAAQRQQRIESRKWYGLSLSRPLVSASPQYGTYSPMWTSGGADPYRFQVVQPSYIIERPAEPVYRAATSPAAGIGRR